jgi:hypothetical protein
MKKVRIVSNDMDDEFILRSTPGGSKTWGDFAFTTEPIVDCDYCIFLNNNNKDSIEICCPPDNIWMFVQEPYQKGLTDWVTERHNYFSKVFTHLPVDQSTKYIRSQTCLPWHIGKTYDQLSKTDTSPKKDKSLSSIVGGAVFLPGHKLRQNFIKKVLDSDLPLELFGKNIRPLEDKAQGLDQYFFSFAVENNSNPDMWTEKLADCYLSWTMPVYYGCTNLDKYFPPKSFIQIDINSPEATIQGLKTKLTQEFWESALDSIREARELVLNKYQLFPFLVEQFEKHRGSGVPMRILIPQYKRSLIAKVNRLRYKIGSSLQKRFPKSTW